MGRPQKSAEELALEKEAAAEQEKAKAERERERELSLIDQARATQKQAAGLTSDLRNVYMGRARSLYTVGK